MKEFKFKTTFQVRPDEYSDQVLAEFTTETDTTDEYDHEALFGEGHRKAKEYVAEHGGVIIRKVVKEVTSYDVYLSGGAYVSYKGDRF